MTKATASATVKRNDKQSISRRAIGKHSLSVYLSVGVYLSLNRSLYIGRT